MNNEYAPIIDAELFSDVVLQGDLFICEAPSWSTKDDIASMEAPVFSLGTQKNMAIREYKRGDKLVRIIPSGVGSATVFDKDLLLYVASQIIDAINRNAPISRTVQIDSADFLNKTCRGKGRKSFENISEMLYRLAGTRIETNIETGGIVQIDGFGLIDGYQIIADKKRTITAINPKTKKPETKEIRRIFSFKITLSEWLFNGLKSMEVLTLDNMYFQLRKTIERRLYEIARKYCGQQAIWKINIDALADKVGTTQPKRQFRSDLRKIIQSDSLPEYHLALDTSKNIEYVVIYTKDNHKLSLEIIKTKCGAWFQQLEKQQASAMT